MCKVNPKKSWHHYLQTKGAKEFLSELESALGFPRAQLIVSITDGLKRERHLGANLKEYIEALKSVVGIPSTDLIQKVQGGDPRRWYDYFTNKGNKAFFDELYSGIETY